MPFESHLKTTNFNILKIPCAIQRLVKFHIHSVRLGRAGRARDLHIATLQGDGSPADRDQLIPIGPLVLLPPKAI